MIGVRVIIHDLRIIIFIVSENRLISGDLSNYTWQEVVFNFILLAGKCEG